MTRTEKLAEARRLLDVSAARSLNVRDALYLTLDLIETSEGDTRPVAPAGAPLPAPAVERDEAWWNGRTVEVQNILRAPRYFDALRSYLRATFSATTAPAPAFVRDEAWWDGTAAMAINAYKTRVDKRPVLEAVRAAAEALRATFGQDPAPEFDVEALAVKFAWSLDRVGLSDGIILQAVHALRDVAREMLAKGGVK